MKYVKEINAQAGLSDPQHEDELSALEHGVLLQDVDAMLDDGEEDDDDDDDNVVTPMASTPVRKDTYKQSSAEEEPRGRSEWVSPVIDQAMLVSTHTYDPPPPAVQDVLRRSEDWEGNFSDFGENDSVHSDAEGLAAPLKPEGLERNLSSTSTIKLDKRRD